jgi:hypothetical protein
VRDQAARIYHRSVSQIEKVLQDLETSELRFGASDLSSALGMDSKKCERSIGLTVALSIIGAISIHMVLRFSISYALISNMPNPS